MVSALASARPSSVSHVDLDTPFNTDPLVAVNKCAHPAFRDQLMDYYER